MKTIFNLTFLDKYKFCFIKILYIFKYYISIKITKIIIFSVTKKKIAIKIFLLFQNKIKVTKKEK